MATRFENAHSGWQFADSLADSARELASKLEGLRVSNVSPNADCILMRSILPLEIEQSILDFLAEDDDGHSALKACSLVCQAFLPICRKHIFGNIILFSSSTHAFDRLLLETPRIADYIRKFVYDISIFDLNRETIRKPLERISTSRLDFLRFLSVRKQNWQSYPKLNWSDNPIRRELLLLLHRPTITHFQVTTLDDFTVSDLIPCVNLKYLDIGCNTTVYTKNTFPAFKSLPEHPIRLNEFESGFGSSEASMDLCTARRSDGQPIIDFGSLSKIKMDFDPKESNDRAAQELFRHCHALTNAEIFFLGPRNVRPSLADLVRPSMQTLKHIAVNVDIYVDDVDPLFDIPSDLEDMRSKNIIETVTIGVLVHARGDCRQGDDWGRLDKVLTAPGWFSLKEVSLTIDFISCGRTEERDERMGVALRKLPETQFPLLSSSTSVSFDFEVFF